MNQTGKLKIEEEKLAEFDCLQMTPFYDLERD